MLRSLDPRNFYWCRLTSAGQEDFFLPREDGSSCPSLDPTVVVDGEEQEFSLRFAPATFDDIS